MSGASQFFALMGLQLTAAAPMTLTGTLSNATGGTAYSSTLTLGGTFTGPVTIDASSGTIPTWMSHSVSGNTVTFSGTAPSTAETDTFTVRATDSSATPQVAVGPGQSVVVSAAATGPTIVQQGYLDGSTAGTPSFATPPTAGNTIIAVYAESGYGGVPAATGWALTSSMGGTSADGYFVLAFKHTVVSGEANSYSPTTSTAAYSLIGIWEVAGAATAVVANAGVFVAGTDTATLPSAAAPTQPSIPVGVIEWVTLSPSNTFTWPAGWTGLGPDQITGFPYHGGGVGYAGLTSAAVTGPTITWTGTRGNGINTVQGLIYIQAP
jgi:hypothetical protein